MTKAAAPLDTSRTLAERFAAGAAERDRTAAFPHAPLAALCDAGLVGSRAGTARRRRGRADAGSAGGGSHRCGRSGGRPDSGDDAAPAWADPSRGHALAPRARRPDRARAAADGALINALRVEPELGTPARGGLPATVARRDGGDWRLTGRKIYSTGAPGSPTASSSPEPTSRNRGSATFWCRCRLPVSASRRPGPSGPARLGQPRRGVRGCARGGRPRGRSAPPGGVAPARSVAAGLELRAAGCPLRRRRAGGASVVRALPARARPRQSRRAARRPAALPRGGRRERAAALRQRPARREPRRRDGCGNAAPPQEAASSS